MNSDLYHYIDPLEAAHQDIKCVWLSWAHDRYEDHGIGSDHNSDTLQYLRHEGVSAVSRCQQLTDVISTHVRDCHDPAERYQIFRELYYIHPSFHERWFFDDHIEYVTKKLLSGRLGVRTFLNNPSRSPSVLKGISTFVLRRTILLENLLAGRLDGTLFDATVLSDAEVRQNSLKFPSSNPSTVEEIVAIMPQVFQFVLTILTRTDYSSLVPEKLIARNNWLLYAPCSINEGPIFQKTSPKTRVEIFSSCHASNIEEFRENLSKYYDVLDVGKDFSAAPDFQWAQIALPIPPRKEHLPAKKKQTSVEVQASSVQSSRKARFDEAFHERMARENEVSDLYGYLFASCRQLFSDPQVMGRSVNFRARNVLGRRELDAINLFPRQSSSKTGLKFQAYTYVIGDCFGVHPDIVAQALPAGSSVWYWQKKDTPDATGLEGSFKTYEEAQRFIACLQQRKVEDIS